MARVLALRGHGVTLVARRADRLTDLAAELSQQGVRVEVVPTDLTDRAARARLPAAVDELGLVVDILVNNAGLSTLGPVSGSDPASEVAMLELDVVAVADLCSRFLPGMVQRKRGALLNVASTAAFQPLPGQAGYGAAKAFVLSYTHSLAGELRGSGVTVSVLCPGPVDTGFGEAAGFSKEDAEASLPRFMWESPRAVAEAGIDGLARGRTVVIPGRANQAAAVFGYHFPRQVLVPMLARRHPGLRAENQK